MSQRWVFTLNNPDIMEHEDFPRYDPGIMSYLVYSLERGEDQNTLHLQGYVRFQSRKRFSTVKRIIGERAHLEKARGDEKSCYEYCTKLDTHIDGPWEFPSHDAYDPTKGAQGHRSDLDAIAAEVREGHTLNRIADQHPADFIRYHNGIQALSLLLSPKPPAMREVEVVCWWGPTGRGKTYRVMTQFPEAYQVEPGRDPWGRYNQEDLVVFDEFNYGSWTIQQMNRYLDPYRCPLDARYHDRFAAWTHVMILSNCSPLTFWPNADLELVNSFRRRIQGRVFHITSRDLPVLEMKDTDCDHLVPLD